MENNNTVENQQEINTEQGIDSSTKQEKTFTQEDVNRIVSERLARVKSDSAHDLQERERKCAQRELLLDAREKLDEAGLPKEIIGAINCSTKEDMENSIKTLQKLFGKNGESNPSRGVYRVSGSIHSNSNGAGHRTGTSDPDSIRKAMGLKG